MSLTLHYGATPHGGGPFRAYCGQTRPVRRKRGLRYTPNLDDVDCLKCIKKAHKEGLA